MKRIIILATAALAIMGCSKDTIDTGADTTTDIVAFSTNPATRGTPIEDASLLTDIGTFGYHTGQSNWTESSLPDLMFNQRLYRDGTKWKYDGTPVQWNGSSASDLFTFYAYAPFSTEDNGIVVNGNNSTGGVPTLTYTVPEDVTKQPDLMVAVPRVDIVKPSSGYVSLNMVHALTTIGFQVAGNGEQITGLAVSGVSMTGTLEMNGSNIEWTNLNTPSTADFSASINFDDGENYYTATPAMSTNLMKDDGYLMMIPQILDDDAALIVYYADGSSIDINIDPHEWLPGKKIIYELTIVQGGVIIVEPSEVSMSFNASSDQILVECSNLRGNPAPSLPWTLTSSETWLTLSLSNDRATANQTLSGEGTQTVYLFSTANGTGADRTAVITLDGTENVVTNVRQFYSAAQGFARSNIVMFIDGNGNKILTFAENEVDHTSPKSVTYHDALTGMTVTDFVPAIPANVQGLHFRWGSLVGITSNGTSGNSFSSSHVVFWPTEYAAPGTWTFSEIPYTGGSDIGANPLGSNNTGFVIDGFAGYPGGTGPGFDKVSAKGDICRYISDMGWVRGKWRMPTTAEIRALVGETDRWYGDNGRVYGSWTSQTISGTGIGNKYGYYAITDVRFVGLGVNGSENQASLTNPGKTRVVFTGSGYRAAPNGMMENLGSYAKYWAATPGNGTGIAYHLEYNGRDNYHSYYMSTRDSGLSVRCVMAE